MGCRGFDNLVLLEYHLGKLDADEQRRVRLHIEHCDECRTALNEMSPMAAAMTETRRATDIDLNEDSVRKIMEAGRVVLKGFKPVPLTPDAPVSPAASVSAPAPVTAIPVTPAWIPTSTVIPLPAEPVRPAARTSASTSTTRRRWTGLRRWALPAAAAAGIAAAFFAWNAQPADPWSELKGKLADGAKLKDLHPAVVAVARAEVLAEDADPAAFADLEFAAWICAHADDEKQRETVAKLIRAPLQKRLATGTWRRPNSERPGIWESVALATSQPMEARRLLHSNQSAAALSMLNGFKGRDAALLRSWAYRGRPTPMWAEAAKEIEAAAAAETPGTAAHSRLVVLSAVYLWEAGRTSSALDSLRTAAEKDNNLWYELAYLYRWGLGNGHMAEWALLHLRNLPALTAYAKSPEFAGRPTLLFPGGFDTPDGSTRTTGTAAATERPPTRAPTRPAAASCVRQK